MRLSLLNQYAGVIVVPYYGFDLAEVLFFLKDGDYSFFDFNCEYSKNDAAVDIKGAGSLYICNLSEDDIPEETVRLVIDVLEHLDEYLEQAYGTFVHWDFDHNTWDFKRKCFKEDPKEVFELDEIIFGLPECWQQCDFQEYCAAPEPKTAGDVFWLKFRCDPLGYLVKFCCEDRRLYSIKPYIL